MAPPTIPPEQRFSSKFRVDESTGCWMWTGSIRANGYSQFRYSKAKNGYGHRFAYEQFRGPIADGHELDHLCRNRACVNPWHLEAVPHRKNLERSPIHNIARTHCRQGHPLDGDNLYVNPSTGRRTCRTCIRAAQLRWRTDNRDHYRAYHRNWQRERYNQKKAKPSTDM